jgi:hypothetical protein
VGSLRKTKHCGIKTYAQESEYYTQKKRVIHVIHKKKKKQKEKKRQRRGDEFGAQVLKSKAQSQTPKNHLNWAHLELTLF